MEQFWEKLAIPLPAMFAKTLVMFKDMSNSLERVRIDMWFDGGNESFNTEAALNNTLVQGMSISIQNYTIIVFRLTLVRCLPT